MNSQRRRLIQLAGLAPAVAVAEGVLPSAMGNGGDSRLVLSDFSRDDPIPIDGAQWRGFSDRVMGGVSDAELNTDVIAGRPCIRLTGNVTRDSGGGFVQMALYLGRRRSYFDASRFRGVELLVYGNDEDYNAHIKTADSQWHSQSYRATFHAAQRWQRIRLTWADFKPNDLTVPMDTYRLQRLGLLGWMREFQADLALAEAALFA